MRSNIRQNAITRCRAAYALRSTHEHLHSAAAELEEAIVALDVAGEYDLLPALKQRLDVLQALDAQSDMIRNAEKAMAKKAGW